MFLNSYKARHKKVKTYRQISFIKYVILLGVLFVVITVYLSSEIKEKKSTFQEDFYIDSYEESNNILKIENATFVGKDKKQQPYTLTAELATKESYRKNLFLLHALKADISLENENWLILKTDKAIYDMNDKILFSENYVEAYYDDGTNFISPSLSYDFNNGIITGKEGIVMSGKWGKIKSGIFSYDPKKEILIFTQNPVMFID